MTSASIFRRFSSLASAVVLVGLLASCSKETIEPSSTTASDIDARRRVVLIDPQTVRPTKPTETKDPSVRQPAPLSDVLTAKSQPCTSCGSGQQATESTDPSLSETFQHDNVEMAAPSGETYPTGPSVKDPTIQVIRFTKAVNKKLVIDRR